MGREIQAYRAILQNDPTNQAAFDGLAVMLKKQDWRALIELHHRITPSSRIGGVW